MLSAGGRCGGSGLWGAGVFSDPPQEKGNVEANTKKLEAKGELHWAVGSHFCFCLQFFFLKTLCLKIKH